jgi:hypothetical protein
MSETNSESPITFTTRLTKEDWDATLNAWRCPPLSIPKAEIVDLFVDGHPVDKAMYKILQPAAIRWIPAEPPERVAAQIRLGAELSLESETEYWKRLAIVLPAIATVLAAAIGALGTYMSRTGADGVNATELVKARLVEWDVNKQNKFVSYRLGVDPLDLSPFVKKSAKDSYKLIVGVREREATPHLNGQYENAFGVYPFDATATLVPPINDKLRSAVAAFKCVDLVLFRVSDSGLSRVPFKTPFVPAYYGSDLKVADSTADGGCQ